LSTGAEEYFDFNGSHYFGCPYQYEIASGALVRLVVIILKAFAPLTPDLFMQMGQVVLSSGMRIAQLGHSF
jgi:hypothetical protein